MATLREFILSQSSLSTGNTVRAHIQSPVICEEVTNVFIDRLAVDLATTNFDVELTTDQFDIEACIK